MAMNWPTFFTRLGSAIVFSIVMMAGFLWNKLAFLVLIEIIQLLCLREYFRLVKQIWPDTKWNPLLPVVTILFALGTTTLLYFTALTGIANIVWPVLLFAPALIILIGALSKKGSVESAVQSLAGLFYICLSFSLLLLLREKSILLPLVLLLMIWMNDTMAYIVGSFIGKTPFSPISPKKTWEGTAGGALLTVIGAVIWGYYTDHYHIIDWVVLSLCAAIAGTAGDLLESKLKRMANVKDSGTMMPGHGGALDRFDSLLIATPFAFCYAWLMMPVLELTIF